MRSLSLACVIIASLTGCQRVGLADDVDLTFDWGFFPEDHLHQPYVAGSSFSLRITDVEAETAARWSLTSEDPGRLTLGETEDGRASATASAAGPATVTVIDESGNPVHAADLDIRQATAAELFAHGGLILHRPELQEDWDQIQVLVGGSATFQVRWLDGSVPLNGNGALSAEASEDVVVEARRSFLFEDREWVTFTPLAPGEHPVTLRANGVAVRTVLILAVEADAVDHIELHGMDESRAQRDDQLAVLAQAYDAEERPIFGVEYSWDLDGEAELGEGDLYRYTFVPGVTGMLHAGAAGHDAQVMIQGEEGYVDSTNRIGCSARPWRSGGGPVTALAALTLLLARRGLRRARA